jgi:hypothetical protein
LAGLGRGISIFEVSGSCESIEEVISDILKLEIRRICSVKVSLVTRMSIYKLGKLPRIFKRPDYSNDPYKNFELPLMTRIYADYSYFPYSCNRALLVESTFLPPSPLLQNRALLQLIAHPGQRVPL